MEYKETLMSVGCLAKVMVLNLKKLKIGPKTIDYILIGYAHNSSAYWFFMYESQILDIKQKLDNWIEECFIL